ncbi:hypothetical protein LE181_15205 [Streptomyces sp. SCA3-4]|uniref:hypothetical protein n=1 Tax=Streptomyces sichuanensis TaxID=2871810 RepID=UPI001CE28B3B|nr:hypothetical protein [Streptomyces sichuanensis]MCA6093503.1 hypothetical protein [Streptomyces sichuanensis]
MPVVDPGPIAIGIVVLTLSLLLGLLLLLWWLLPNPHTGFTPPPNAPGHRYRCYCYAEPITVVVLASPEDEKRLLARARRQRRHRRHARSAPSRPWRRIRPAPPGHEGAGGRGRGRPPAPVTV